MMGPEYFTVAGYYTDGDVLCRDCGDKQALLPRDQFTVAQAESDFPEGLSCCACYATIVETPEPEPDEEESAE